MNLIGYWIESLADTRYFPPQEMVGGFSGETLARVADYLDAGEVFETYRGVSWCRFGCRHVPMGGRELTDGEWVWPEGLSHYVREHGVSLPEQFIEHALSGRNRTPWQTQSQLPDEGLWLEWCRKRSSGHLQAALEIARQRAESRADELREAHWRHKEVQIGLSGEKCTYKDCSRSALNGVVICAEHASKMEAFDPGWGAFYEGLIEVLNT